ncbi:MAG: histidine phosphatase family protein [Ruminococcaceae bacterium]|nr:histidine phosphatase family protein [Oscillospiraceae bacterium]
MTCYLIRHGKDDDTVRGGWSSAPLTEEGIAQAERLALTLSQDKAAAITALFSSDLPRAMQTAEILAQRLSLTVAALPQFRETNNGVLAGMKNSVAEERYPGLYWNTLQWEEQYPEGESPRMFYERVCKAWQSLKADTAQKAKGDVALVTHAGVIDVILCIEKGVTYTNRAPCFHIGNAQYVCVEI